MRARVAPPVHHEDPRVSAYPVVAGISLVIDAMDVVRYDLGDGQLLE